MQITATPDESPAIPSVEQAMLDSMPLPIWVCRGDGSIARANAAARRLEHWPQAVALLMLEVPATPSVSLALGRIQQRFGLTRSEVAVLGDVASGRTVAQIAANRHVQAVTVRAHLRSIFDKTGRRRQADLVRLVVCE